MAGHSAAGKIRSIEKKKSNDLIGNRTRGLPACNIVSQPTTLAHAHVTALIFCIVGRHFRIFLVPAPEIL
jgi:hypothetical protein